jgi:hypothetical protein
MMRLPLTVMLAVFALPALAAPATPVVVETFTSKYCPNCPAGEATLNSKAEGHTDYMVVLEHVDYWDDPANHHIDPLGSPDFTQRQYDYSNRLGNRPGEVFTPAPILDGNLMAKPPLWLGWGDIVDKAEAANRKMKLGLKPLPGGAWQVDLPAGAKTQGESLTLLAIEKNPERPNLWQARAMNSVPVSGASTTIQKPMVPQGGDHLLVLLQESGGGAVTGMGMVSR